MDKWTVTLPFEDVEQMRTARAKAESEATELRRQLAEARLDSGGGDGGKISRLLVVGLRAALPVVQWAQGNYDPETVRGWPHQELRVLADVVKAMPGATELEKEWAGDVKYYADMAEAVEKARKAGRQKELGQIPRAAIGTGAYAAQVEQILSQPPKSQEPSSESGGGEDPPQQPPA